MSAIVELRLPARGFRFGHALSMQSGTQIELETVVPLGDKQVPFFWAYHSDFRTLRDSIETHEEVDSVRVVDSFEDRVLFALEYDVNADPLFSAILANDGVILEATGTDTVWRFDIRFPTHDDLSAFQEAADEEAIPIDVLRVYNPTKPDAGPHFGLTDRQYETMVLAIRLGYYDIPRRCTTVELADRLGISDQAVTERLRRAIVALVSNTLLATDGVEAELNDD